MRSSLPPVVVETASDGRLPHMCEGEVVIPKCKLFAYGGLRLSRFTAQLCKIEKKLEKYGKVTKNSCAPARRSQWPSHVHHSQRFLLGMMRHWIQSPAQCLEWLQLQACLESYTNCVESSILFALMCRVQEQLLQPSEHRKTSSAIPVSRSSGVPPTTPVPTYRLE